MTTTKLHPEGMLAEKVGMSQMFLPDGECVPVTVLRTGPCYILGLRTKGTHGYDAVQMGFGEARMQRVNKAARGLFEKVGRGAFRHVSEIRCDHDVLGWKEVGQEVLAKDVFAEGQLVDVTGVSKGKGFQGVIKRHSMKGQPATRGTHEDRRNIGSIGCRKYPGRVFKNKRMAGHMGAEQVTTQNLKVVAIIPEENVVLVRGSVPGAKGGLVVIKKAMKSFASVKAA